MSRFSFYYDHEDDTGSLIRIMGNEHPCLKSETQSLNSQDWNPGMFDGLPVHHTYLKDNVIIEDVFDTVDNILGF